MDAVFWLSVTVACLLGAMSPGPSLAVIGSLALNYGRLAGVMAAVAHGLAITAFALVTALGLVVLLGRYELVFNLKIILFFSALFSQFISVDSELWVKLVMAGIAGSVDALWYVLVAVIISQPGNLLRYQKSGRWLNKLFGVLLLFIASGFVVEFFIS